MQAQASAHLVHGAAPGEVPPDQLDQGYPHNSSGFLLTCHLLHCIVLLQAQASAHVVHGAAPGEVPPDQLGQVDPDGNLVQQGLSDDQQYEMDRQHQEATLQVGLVCHAGDRYTGVHSPVWCRG